MKRSNYKPVMSSHGGTFNIRYCPKCRKYQHYKRYNRKKKCYEHCSICGYEVEVNDV